MSNPSPRTASSNATASHSFPLSVQQSKHQPRNRCCVPARHRSAKERLRRQHLLCLHGWCALPPKLTELTHANDTAALAHGGRSPIFVSHAPQRRACQRRGARVSKCCTTTWRSTRRARSESDLSPSATTCLMLPKVCCLHTVQPVAHTNTIPLLHPDSSLHRSASASQATAAPLCSVLSRSKQSCFRSRAAALATRRSSGGCALRRFWAWTWASMICCGSCAVPTEP